MPKFNVQDKFFKQAKTQGYRARSAFKLQAIDDRYHLFKPGQKVLDLGAAPGSFLQYIRRQVGEKGIVVGVDLQKITPFGEPNIHTFVGDVFDEKRMGEIMDQLKIKSFDVITSDMAPKTTGIKFVDGGASLDLNLQVLELSQKYLKSGGHVVMKILPGFDEGELMGPTKDLFKQVKKYRPPAVRGSSGESYVVGMDTY